MIIPLPPQVNAVISRLESSGFEAFVVGGAVRDCVMGGAAKDWDIATSAPPSEVEAVFAGFRLIETGLKHGTVTLVLEGMPLEITTYRIDGEYSDHRRPDSVRFTRSLEDDLKRRDFTMNALAYSPRTGIIDVTSGIDDIKSRLVRCVGDPEQRFREDGLRILRALRFASVYNMRLERETAAAAHRCGELLKSIAAERVQVELTKLLCGEGAPDILENFSAVIAVPLPELTPMFGFDQRNPHHDRDVWRHTLAAVGAAPSEPVLRWAALLHDTGKPHSFTVDDDGVGHFYGHAERSVQIAGEIMRRLRFDTASRERIELLVRYHDLPLTPDKKAVRRLLRRFGEESVRQLIELHKADAAGQSPAYSARLGEYERVYTVLGDILREEACFSLKELAVNGDDMLRLGFRGRGVGRALDICLTAVIEERVPNDKPALIALAESISRD